MSERLLTPADHRLLLAAHRPHTIENKFSRFAQFQNYWWQRNQTEEFRPEIARSVYLPSHVEMFCLELVDKDFKSVANYLWSIKSTLLLPPINPATGSPYMWLSPHAGLTSATAWNTCDEAVKRAIVKTVAQTAKPLTRQALAEHWEKMTPELKNFWLLWLALGLREDSMLALTNSDIHWNWQAAEAHTTVAADKIWNRKGRIIKIGCNCIMTGDTVDETWCIFHHAARGMLNLPPGRTQLQRTHKALGTTGHSARVTLACEAKRMIKWGRHFKKSAWLEDRGWGSWALFCRYTTPETSYPNKEFPPCIGTWRLLPAAANDTTQGEDFPETVAEAQKLLEKEGAEEEDAELRDLAKSTLSTELQPEEKAAGTEDHTIRAWREGAGKALAKGKQPKGEIRVSGAKKTSKNGKQIIKKLKGLQRKKAAGKKEKKKKPAGGGKKAKP